jgi:hypothetical protein
LELGLIIAAAVIWYANRPDKASAEREAHYRREQRPK